MWLDDVAPYAGAWIEIKAQTLLHSTLRPSLPTRERGLKFVRPIPIAPPTAVAPYAGAWIEMA